jgi:hypothetical protein
MPITYLIDRERKVVIARGYGTFTDDDVFGYQREVWSGKDVVGYDELVDMTHVSKIQMPSVQRLQDLASTAAKVDLAPAPSRFAIVAPDDVAFRLGRMYGAYREWQESSSRKVGVFRTIEEAVAFLRLDDLPPLPPLP